MGTLRTEFRLKSTAFVFLFSAIFVLFGGILFSNKRLKPSPEQIMAAEESGKHSRLLALYKDQLFYAENFETRCLLLSLFLLGMGAVFLQMLLLYKHDQSHFSLEEEG